MVQAGVASLDYTTPKMATVRFIDNQDNRKTLDMAIDLVTGEAFQPSPDEELILALRRGEKYVEPLLARKGLSDCHIVDADQESQAAMDNFHPTCYPSSVYFCQSTRQPSAISRF